MMLTTLTEAVFLYYLQCIQSCALHKVENTTILVFMRPQLPDLTVKEKFKLLNSAPFKHTLNQL